jgi:uncharacterized protein DUF669
MRLGYNQSDYTGPARAKYDPVPEERYALHIVSLEERKPRNGGLPYLVASLEIIGGPYAGQMIWDAFAVDCESERGRNFARRRLNALARSAGLILLGDTKELVGRRVIAEIDIVQDGDYPAKNRVVEYLADTPQPAGLPAPAPMPSQANGKAELDDDIPF